MHVDLLHGENLLMTDYHVGIVYFHSCNYIDAVFGACNQM